MKKINPECVFQKGSLTPTNNEPGYGDRDATPDGDATTKGATAIAGGTGIADAMPKGATDEETK